jgi:hypothetical protein
MDQRLAAVGFNAARYFLPEKRRILELRLCGAMWQPLISY